jgi:SAM-dependent methyltransferase
MNPKVKATIELIWEQALNNEYNTIENINNEIDSQCRFLEIGCGPLGFLQRKKDRLCDLYHSSVGIDIDREALSKNHQVKYPVCASCYSLPLKSHTVDIVVCRWLFEHLARPGTAIQEISRVLKKGGYLFITTPNLLNYAMLISKLTPTFFHNIIRAAGGSHKNTPTFYRANSKKKMIQLASQNNFEIKHMETTPYSFMYYNFNKILFFTMKRLSELMSNVTTQLHLKITCVMKKVDD